MCIPSAENGLDHFRDCILHVEEDLNSFDGETTAIVIAGDFNAHLDTLAGPRGQGTLNQRGLILKEFIDRNHLFVASHSSSSCGPP